MTNPFERRATEYLKDDIAFLSVVAAEPIKTYLEKSAKSRKLYDQLTLIIGNPGSGKTTLARLFEYKTLNTLIRNRNLTTHKPLMETLAASGVISDGKPNVLACRIPLESVYRNFWALPYPDDLKLSLMVAFIQARVVLGWFRNLKAAGIDASEVRLIPQAGSSASVDAIGGTEGVAILNRAREMERAIYTISASLVPPPIEQISRQATSAYQPFDVVEGFEFPVGGVRTALPALAIFDDAHLLHPTQFDEFSKWLARRELRISRWLITRLDLLTPAQVFAEEAGTGAGFASGREVNVISMQGVSRGAGREAFRRMAREMANRYLRQAETFQRRGLNDLGDLLETAPPETSATKLKELTKAIESTARRLGITNSIKDELQDSVEKHYASTRSPESADVKEQALLILLNRFSKRSLPPTLFDVPEEPPERFPRMKSSVADGARIQLLHSNDRPLYFGLDAVARASSENAELFLSLCGPLVDRAEMQLMRGKGPQLDARVQHRVLTEHARKIVNEWDFPYAAQVRRLADGMAKQCLDKSLEPNASLGGGASAFGIPQEEFERAALQNPDLARVLKFGLSYNAFEIRQHHLTKNRPWTLIQLGGPVLVLHGLTLQQGGFLERTTDDLLDLLKPRTEY